VREAQLAQYNFILVVGAQEMADGTVNVRTRDNAVHGTKSVDDLITEFKRLDAEKSPDPKVGEADPKP
jgi:threonyl-tRNA synthetase